MISKRYRYLETSASFAIKFATNKFQILNQGSDLHCLHGEQCGEGCQAHPIQAAQDIGNRLWLDIESTLPSYLNVPTKEPLIRRSIFLFVPRQRVAQTLKVRSQSPLRHLNKIPRVGLLLVLLTFNSILLQFLCFLYLFLFF